MRLGVNLPAVGLDHSREFLMPVAEAAERLGFDSVWANDHIALPYSRRSQYPYQRSGTEIAMEPGMQWIDPLATLSFVSALTERVKLGTSVVVVPYRNPLLLAHQCATLDVLSEGRLLLGVGIGWMREEFDALGVPPAERGARTDEALEVMRLLWTEDPASFQGRFTSFDEMALTVQPRTEGGPPVWVGGNTDPALRRALRYGAAWHGFEIFPEELADIRERLARHSDEVGRDPATLELTIARGLMIPGTEEDSWIPGRRWLGGEHPSTESIVDELGTLADEGVSMCLIQISALAPLIPEALEWVAAEVVPKLRPRVS